MTYSVLDYTDRGKKEGKETRVRAKACGLSAQREKPGKEESSQGKGDFPTNGCWFPGSLAKKFRVQLPKFCAAAIRSRLRRSV